MRLPSGDSTGHGTIAIEDTLDTVDAHCFGLQAQLEAGSRAVGKMGRDAARGELMTAAELRNAALMGSVARRTRELQQCIREQLATLADLRTEMAKLRHQLRARRSAIEEAAAEHHRSM
jgi:hypothetical protein